MDFCRLYPELVIGSEGALIKQGSCRRWSRSRQSGVSRADYIDNIIDNRIGSKQGRMSVLPPLNIAHQRARCLLPHRMETCR